jgi:hypothetical protein
MTKTRFLAAVAVSLISIAGGCSALPGAQPPFAGDGRLEYTYLLPTGGTATEGGSGSWSFSRTAVPLQQSTVWNGSFATGTAFVGQSGTWPAQISQGTGVSMLPTYSFDITTPAGESFHIPRMSVSNSVDAGCSTNNRTTFFAMAPDPTSGVTITISLCSPASEFTATL